MGNRKQRGGWEWSSWLSWTTSTTPGQSLLSWLIGNKNADATTSSPESTAVSVDSTESHEADSASNTDTSYKISGGKKHKKSVKKSKGKKHQKSAKR